MASSTNTTSSSSTLLVLIYQFLFFASILHLSRCAQRANNSRSSNTHRFVLLSSSQGRVLRRPRNTVGTPASRLFQRPSRMGRPTWIFSETAPAEDASTDPTTTSTSARSIFLLVRGGGGDDDGDTDIDRETFVNESHKKLEEIITGDTSSEDNNDELKSPQSISSSVEEVVAFPTTATGNKMEYQHVPLDANEHAVGYLNRILNARVYEAAIETELQYAKNLSTDLKNTVFLKREDTQPVFSFKIRGAYNKMAHLSPDELSQGVVACSAGNHAQGVALSSKMLGCRAVIVMPLATPVIKVTAVRAHGGPTVEVRLFGNNYDEAAVEAKRLMAEEGMTMIHPFDDPLVIAGQGTIGLEILKSCVSRPLDAIFVCCGGGGMLAGIAAYVKRVRPSVKVIGVEANDAAGMTESLKHGEVTTLDNVGLFADGAAVKTIGDETFRICKKLVDGMVTVDTDQICNAIKMTYNDARVVLEPAGALAVAGMKKYITENEISRQTYVAITSGANLDFDRLRFVSERADGSEKTLVVTIPETPGSFRALYSLIWPRNVTEFSYRYDSDDDEGAHVLISFQPAMKIENDFEGIMDNIRENGFACTDVSQSELMKVHIRNMAGGRSSVPNERLFRFEFPESPGALQRFLLSLDIEWNVSLFHYRNHGDDFGRVLVGLQVPDCESTNDRLKCFLDTLHFNYEEETKNPIYQQFLRSKR